MISLYISGVIGLHLLHTLHALDILVLYTLLSNSDINYLRNFVCNTNNPNSHYIFLLDESNLIVDEKIRNCISYDYITIYDLFNDEDEVYQDMNRMLTETLTIVNYPLVYFCYYMIQYDYVILNNMKDTHSKYKYIYEFIPLIPFHSKLLILPDHLIIINNDNIEDNYSIEYLLLYSNISFSNDYNKPMNILYKNNFRTDQSRYNITNEIYQKKIPNTNIIDYRTIIPSLDENISNLISEVAKYAQLNHPKRINYHGYSDILCEYQKELLFHSDGLKVINNLHIISNHTIYINNTDNNSNNDNINEENKQSLDLLLCLTFTYEPNHHHIQTIVKTWGRKCNGYLAFSNKTDIKNSIIHGNFNRPEAYDHMWSKTVLMIKTIATTSLINEYEYFLFGGDDLYIIIENLNHFLNSNYIKKQSNHGLNPLYIGRIVKHNLYLRYNSGGSGYILNRIAINRLFHMFLLPNSTCLIHSRTSMEDVMIGHCLLQAGILPLDYKEYMKDNTIHKNKHFFHPITPIEAYQGLQEWYINRIESYDLGSQCCSNYSISFQSIAPPLKMICLDYFIYHKTPLL